MTCLMFSARKFMVAAVEVRSANEKLLFAATCAVSAANWAPDGTSRNCRPALVICSVYWFEALQVADVSPPSDMSLPWQWFTFGPAGPLAFSTYIYWPAPLPVTSTCVGYWPVGIRPVTGLPEFDCSAAALTTATSLVVPFVT